MSDPVLALILVIGFFAAVTAASYFRNLDTGLWRDARVALVAGALAGVLARLTPRAPLFAAIGVILTAAALYVRLTGRESEPSDGMILGAITGAAASVPLILTADEDELVRFSACILAGAMAGFGITFGLTHVRDKFRQAIVDAITAALAVGAAAAPGLAQRAMRIPDRQAAIAAAALIPLLAIITVFKQWPAIGAELRDEAKLGFIADEDVRPTAHPLRRLGRAGWHDAGAHREFVRIANKIALRKRQQRNRPEDVARLYQLEVIKLRMELQEMARIDRAMRLAAEREASASS